MKNIEKLMGEKYTHISKDMYLLPITKCTHYYNIPVKMSPVKGEVEMQNLIL